jgi:hypothetical protein
MGDGINPRTARRVVGSVLQQQGPGPLQVRGGIDPAEGGDRLRHSLQHPGCLRINLFLANPDGERPH